MSNKRYKLLKDLPDCNAGNEVKYDDKAKEYYAETIGGSRIYFQEPTVELQPDWFEEVKPERIEVTIDKGTFGTALFIKCSNEIPEDKFSAIKKAIESVLNDVQTMGIQDEYNGSRIYSEAELNKAREEAFNAARETKPVRTISFLNQVREHLMYLTFQDYLNSIQK